MNKYITAIILVAALSGCEDATKALDQAQEAANQAVDSVQEKMSEIDLGNLNLEQFGDATESAKELAASVQEALDVDLSDQGALAEAKDNIANAYSCLVDASSESTAEKLMNKVLSTIGSEETKSLIEKSIEKAKAAKECVM